MKARRIETAGLELGGGLEVLISASMEGIEPGGPIEIESPSRQVSLELPGWARINGHKVIDQWQEVNGRDARWVVLLERGLHDHPQPGSLEPLTPQLRRGEFHSADLRQSDPPKEADPAEGFTPLGSLREPGSSPYDWRLNKLDGIWADDIAELTEQASVAQWDASRDIPWTEATGLDPTIERAVAQVMTFIAQNEYAALYVPARFLDQVNPRYVEVLMWLSAHVHDEARHVEVFTKRALIGGQAGVALASTELSLKTLLDEDDFTAAALLLNVLGEGTFLDLLKFIAEHAPDPATKAAARLAHRDEQRHVHFGISHVKRSLGTDQDARRALIQATENRAAKLTSLSGLSPLLTESLTLMTAGSLQPAELSEAADGVRGLLETMERNRIRRLTAAGFDETTARHLSDLHTPNLM